MLLSTAPLSSLGDEGCMVLQSQAEQDAAHHNLLKEGLDPQQMEKQYIHEFTGMAPNSWRTNNRDWPLSAGLKYKSNDKNMHERKSEPAAIPCNACASVNEVRAAAGLVCLQ